MAAPNSRESLKTYCLRRLGHPVVEINIDDDQLEDRIDDAFLFFQDYHFDGVERIFLKHVITATDITNGYIPIADAIIGVKKIFPLSSSSFASSSMFNVKYQFMKDEAFNLSGGGLIHYDMTMKNIALMENLFTETPPITFHRHKNQLAIEINWAEVTAGNYIMVECYRILDPNTYTDVYNDRFLKQYLTESIKQQWGTNLKKYDGVALPGGITLNGQAIYDEATEALNKLEEEVELKYELPVDFFVG